MTGFASEITFMTSLEKITIAPSLTFDALTAGEPGAPLVLLLHGFAESMHCWRAQVAALGRCRLSRDGAEPARLFAGRAAGYRATPPTITSTG